MKDIVIDERCPRCGHYLVLREIIHPMNSQPYLVWMCVNKCIMAKTLYKILKENEDGM